MSDSNVVQRSSAVVEGAVSDTHLERVFDAVYEYTATYCGLTYEFRVGHAAWCIGTWRFRDFQSYPMLQLTGPPGYGKTVTMEVTRNLVEHASPIMNCATEAVLFRRAAKGETLFLDELNKRPDNRFLEILRSGYSHKGVVPRNEPTGKGGYIMRDFSVYCPKMLAGQEPLKDAALRSRIIMENMLHVPERDEPWPPYIPKSIEKATESLRIRLGQWKSKTGSLDYEQTVMPDGLESRMAQTFLPLFTLTPQKHRAALMDLVKRHKRVVVRESADTVEVEVLQALCDMDLADQREDVSILPGRVANRINNVRDIDARHKDAMTGRKVGDSLSRLGLPRGKHTRDGDPFIIQPGKLASLKLTYGIEDEGPEVPA
jgi:hypothetical protein